MKQNNKFSIFTISVIVRYILGCIVIYVYKYTAVYISQMIYTYDTIDAAYEIVDSIRLHPLAIHLTFHKFSYNFQSEYKTLIIVEFNKVQSKSWVWCLYY